MYKVFSDNGALLLGINKTDRTILSTPGQFSEYTILFISEGQGIYQADFASFEFAAPALLFSTPQQTIHIKKLNP